MNLSQFKKRLAVGVKLHCTFHREFSHRVPASDIPFGRETIVYKDKDLGVRPVSIVQSNSFALKTTRTDGRLVDSWCSYPKASEMKVNSEDSITILETDRDNNTYPILTYTFV